MTSRLVLSTRALASQCIQPTARRSFTSCASLHSSFESALAAASSGQAKSRPALSGEQQVPLQSSTSFIPVPSRPPPAPSADPTPDQALLETLARLIMKSGKLARAHSHLSLCLSTLALQTSSPPLPILHRALEIVSPSIRMVGRRKGTKSLPTPQPLTQDQRTRQAWKWIVEASDKRQGAEKLFGKRLAAEVLSVLNGQSEAIKKKEAK